MKDTTEKAEEKCRIEEIPMSIEQMIQNYGTYIYNFALKLSGNVKDAEDVAQDTFIKAWRHMDTLKEIHAIKKWLRTICLNEYRMKLKKEKNIDITYIENMEDVERDGRLLSSCIPSLQEEVILTEEVEKIRNGCFFTMANKLTFHQRITFSLVDMLGLSIKEVAEILEITPKAVKGLLYRARMNLESFFHNHCSILDIQNACQCLAWKDFVEQRADMQIKVRGPFEDAAYRKSTYVYHEKTRQTLLYYYRNMPIQKPEEAWFLNIIAIVHEILK